MPLFFSRRLRKRSREIDPDEILMDSSNLPEYDTNQLEGRIVKPISRYALFGVVIVFLMMSSVFIFQSGKMQLVNGAEYREKSEKNLLRPVPIFAVRGVVYDRNGQLLAWNTPSLDSSLQDGLEKDAVSHREYATSSGLAHILGYVQYPSKDSNGFYYQEDFHGLDGAEKNFDSILKGRAGSRLVEVDARGNVISHNIVEPPAQGGSVTLSIDIRVQSALYDNIKDIAQRVGFSGGAGVIMDVRSGEVLALTSYPEYSSQIMSDRDDSKRIKSLLNDPGLPFLNRAIDGLYTPGSIVKPFIALGALNEKVIDPSTVIITQGFISIPNPYVPDKPTIFRDWKNLGPVNMRQAIAMSSDVYFYTVGGGYKDQKGLGIVKIDNYLNKFGFGTTTSHSDLTKKAGTIPTPEWKQKTFNESWNVGNTYHTAIGQYGFQVTPIQIVRAIATIATRGIMVEPTLVKGKETSTRQIDIPEKYFKIVQEGMRLSVTEGTSKALNVPFVEIAGKSGTAELGVSKDKVNSWITGYWPYNNPKYAFAVMLEKGSVHNLIGAAAAMRQQLDWMEANTPEYFK